MNRTRFLLSLFAALTPSLPPDNAVVNTPTAVFAKLRLMPLQLLALLLSVQLGAASDRLQSSVLAFWPMDDPMYAQATLTDAGPNQFDLTLWEGELATGRFGGALLVRAERGHPLYYAGYPGSYFDRMRMPDGQPTGLWGPTLPPTALLERLAEGSWSLEFWIRMDKAPTAPFTILDLGDALAPGFALSADPLSGVIRLANHYAGFEARIRTDDGQRLLAGAEFLDPTAPLERISFRTGEFRVSPTTRDPKSPGEDLPGTDDPIREALFYLDDVSVSNN